MQFEEFFSLKEQFFEDQIRGSGFLTGSQIITSRVKFGQRAASLTSWFRSYVVHRKHFAAKDKTGPSLPLVIFLDDYQVFCLD